MKTECEAHQIIKQAEYKLRNDLGNGLIDVSGLLAILRGQGDSACSA